MALPRCFRVTYDGLPLDTPPPDKHIVEYSMEMEEMNTAHEWDLTPSLWYREPRWSRRIMVGWRWERQKVDYQRMKDAEDERDK